MENASAHFFYVRRTLDIYWNSKPRAFSSLFKSEMRTVHAVEVEHRRSDDISLLLLGGIVENVNK